MSALSPSPVYKAYSRLPSNHVVQEEHVARQLDTLLEMAKQVESPFVCEFKPMIAVALKWKFDFLAKTLDSPFEIGRDIAYWIDLLSMLKTLGEQHWFELVPEKTERTSDVWERTANAFDIGWITTTEGERFRVSQEIARERLAQIIELIGGKAWFVGKDVLDSGCGPGRYIDLLQDLSPRRVVGLDQGAGLIEVLRTRFRNSSLIEIVHGTCERLEFPDSSFDFVLSNGVLHHTRSDLQTMIADHCRVLRKGGVMFIMLIGKGGLELRMWEFLRAFLYDVPIESILGRFGTVMSPLRLQGIVDHMYGEYQETDRVEFERWCSRFFTRAERVPGIDGLDVTPELYPDDPFFTARFGCGQLRYLCYK
ncbi:class I SAM-dependent methyltransferase [Nitrospiraceae bacterium AH_259_D15_M11_P09]|nr:class I SAM-dependent methyltransferase [Nitrospiraceae bacterium AH_259_D15_M11_P09]